MKTQLKPTKSSTQGFSLVELLVVIAVIGVIASIAIPSIGSINGAAKTASYQRNAQSIVSTFQAGQAAGLLWTGATRNALVAKVVSGQAPADGAFLNKTFKVPSIALADQVLSYTYIGMDADGNLFYDKAGAQASS